MALDFNKIEEPDDSVFPVKLGDDSNLDMYGVWVKKRPEHKDKNGYENALPIEDDTAEIPLENDFVEFDDHDIVDLDNSETGLEFEELTDLNSFENIDTEDSLEDLSFTSDRDGIETNEENVISEENDIYEDEFDIFSEADPVEIEENDKMEIEEISTEDETSPKNDINDFETLDVDDFLSDEKTVSMDDKTDNKDDTDNLIPENEIKLDLSFDEDYLETKESNAIDFEGDNSFEITSDEADGTEISSGDISEKSEFENLPERTIEDISDFDEIFDELESNEEVEKDMAGKLTDDIPLNITIDEYSDITSIAGKTIGSDDDLEDVEIFSDIDEFEEVEEVNKEEQNDKGGLVIENTIIEAGNIEEIRKENQKIMNDSSSEEVEEETAEADKYDDFDAMLDNVMDEETHEEADDEIQDIQSDSNMFFDDIGALENDLLDTQAPETEEDIKPELKKEPEEPASKSAVLANDKATEILIQIASELVNIKNELATMKFEMAQTQQKLEESDIKEAGENAAGNILSNVTASDETGFFNDDDGDETIALTGDELNNILITADFTEENTEKDYEIPETLDEIHDVFPEDTETSDDDINKEVFKDEDLLTAVEPKHINDLTDDISYLDDDTDLDIENDLENEPKLEVEDFTSDENEPVTEEQNFEEFPSEDTRGIDDFDMPITELELPDGQSIPLGDEYSDFEAITKNIEEGQDEAAIFEDTSFEDDALEEENLEDDNKIDEPSIREENVESVFSAEELDQAAQDIPRLDLDESAAEEQKIQTETLPIHLKDEIKSVLTYMDQLLESLPEEKIEEFAKSEYFDTYKRLFDELGIS